MCGSANVNKYIAIYLEEIDGFRPVHPGNFKDMDDLLDIAIIMLKIKNGHI